MMDLKNVPTCDLVNELVKRQEVDEIVAEFEKNFFIGIGVDPDGEHQDDTITGSGPARILIVTD
jgi:hypothetical protein